MFFILMEFNGGLVIAGSENTEEEAWEAARAMSADSPERQVSVVEFQHAFQAGYRVLRDTLTTA